jgi:hypothetical protein
MMSRSKDMATNVDSILDEISSLSLEDQEMVDEILHKRIIEGKRDEIRADYVVALDEHAHGRIKSGSVGDLFGST